MAGFGHRLPACSQVLVIFQPRLLVDTEMTEVLYKSSLTREPFLFYEMRTVCRLLDKGVARDDIVKTFEKQNLFQYPTEKSVRRMAKACLARVGCSGAYENSFLGLDFQFPGNTKTVLEKRSVIPHFSYIVVRV